MDGVNDDLLGLLSWGRNRVTGVSTATSINFSADTTVQKYSEGFPRLFAVPQKQPDGSPAGSRWRQLPERNHG